MHPRRERYRSPVSQRKIKVVVIVSTVVKVYAQKRKFFASLFTPELLSNKRMQFSWCSGKLLRKEQYFCSPWLSSKEEDRVECTMDK